MWTSGGNAGERGSASRGAEERITPAPLLPCSPAPRPTLVLGLGNPILGDDGVGWRVVEEAKRLVEAGLPQQVAARSAVCDEVITPTCGIASGYRPRNDTSSAVEFDCVSLGGLALMERLIGYDRAVIVDAIQTRGGVPGAVYRLTLDDLPTLHADSAHDASLKAALALGRQLGAKLPAEIVVYAVEATDVLDFREELSPQVAASVGQAAELVLAELADS